MATEFLAYSIIQKKRDKEKLTKEEIEWFIRGLTDHSIADYQMSALLMAIFLNGMDEKETAHLTEAMLYSGKTLNFPGPLFIDKHSTGGVGDKTSFIIGPIAAACGVKVPMIAGRGLGHTGGTVDKIESIAGFKTELPLSEFEKLVANNGLALIGQSAEIAPADRKIYALRDVTATIESIPLITASIMSKKLAEGAAGIVMDIKTGNGAFMSKLSDAKKLATSLRKTAARFEKNMLTVISDMSQPLGKSIGNSLEIIESIETLKGLGPSDLTELSVTLAGGMIYLAGLSRTLAEGSKKARRALEDQSALKKFRELIKAQGGNPQVVDDYSLLPTAQAVTEVRSSKKGYVTRMECIELGLHSVKLGGGRRTLSDSIDHSVGLVLNKKIGDAVACGDVLARIHHRHDQSALVAQIALEMTQKNIVLKPSKPLVKKNIIDIQTQFSPKRKKP